jgi:hypothetical protein
MVPADRPALAAVHQPLPSLPLRPRRSRHAGFTWLTTPPLVRTPRPVGRLDLAGRQRQAYWARQAHAFAHPLGQAWEAQGAGSHPGVRSRRLPS